MMKQLINDLNKNSDAVYWAADHIKIFVALFDHVL